MLDDDVRVGRPQVVPAAAPARGNRGRLDRGHRQRVAARRLGEVRGDRLATVEEVLEEVADVGVHRLEYDADTQRRRVALVLKT